MAISEAQKLAKMRYSKKMSKITIEVKKDDGKRYRQAAADRGMSLTGLLKLSVEEYIQNHPVEGKE